VAGKMPVVLQIGVTARQVERRTSFALRALAGDSIE
jgi:hypothetical protein